MTIRWFIDSQRVEWRVWATVPGNGAGTVRSRIREEWLTFDDGTQRRRLTPIPADWDAARDELLEAYCRSAKPVNATMVRSILHID